MLRLIKSGSEGRQAKNWLVDFVARLTSRLDNRRFVSR